MRQILIFLIAFLSPFTTGFAFSCELTELEQFWEKSRQPSLNRVAQLLQADNKLISFVKEQFPNWLQGRRLPELSCVTNKAFKKRLVESLNADFYRQSLDVLQNRGGMFSKRFVSNIRNKYGNDYLPGLQVFLEANTTGLPAGFNRSSSGVFFEINRINPSVWFAYFVHELSHAIDEDLSTAQAAFGRAGPKVPNIILQLATSIPDTQSVTFANALVWTDIRRGYLSEVFAWKSTFDVLNELPRDIFSRSESDFLASAFGNQSTFRYSELNAILLPRFASPSDGLYQSQNFKDIILSLRKTISDALAIDDWKFIETKSQKSFEILMQK